MYSAEVITPQHLARKAVIYIRQSTPHQALSHQESLRLQYALTERAHALGWAAEAIDVIDTDVGYSAASAQHREGFNTLVGQVTLGQIGIILSYDVTRLSRNCSDWYPLLDLYSYKPMVLVSYKLQMCIELYKLTIHILELTIVLPLFHTGQCDILPLTGEPHDHLGFDHRFILPRR